MAGEPSGDEHAGAVATHLRARYPGARLIGTGGPRMQAAGVVLLAGLDDMAVMGFVEVIPHLRRLRRLEGTIRSLLATERPDLVVLVDYPGLNLRVARAACELGLKVLYTIAPKAWAWRTGRARALAESTDRVALILPFEPEFFAPYGVRFSFVGHPLLDRVDDVHDRSTFFDRWGLDPDRPLLALLPGSRPQEIRRHLGVFTEIARDVAADRRDVLPVFSRAPSIDALPFHATGIPLVEDARALLRYADAALIASGTATLEAAIEGTPHVVGYRTSTVTSVIAKRLLRVEYVGLPNLVAGRQVVPEFLQEELRPSVVAPVLRKLLDPKGDTRARQVEELEGVVKKLGTPGAAERVAELADELLQGRAA